MSSRIAWPAVFHVVLPGSGWDPPRLCDGPIVIPVPVDADGDADLSGLIRVLEDDFAPDCSPRVLRVAKELVENIVGDAVGLDLFRPLAELLGQCIVGNKLGPFFTELCRCAGQALDRSLQVEWGRLCSAGAAPTEALA